MGYAKMRIQKFADKYNTSSANIHMRRKKGQIPEWVFYKPKGAKVLQIHESYFVSRKKFQEDVRQFNIDVYYYLSKFHSDTFIAMDIHNHCNGLITQMSLQVFCGNGLFRDKISKLAVKVSNRDWVFFRYGRAMLRKRGMSIEELRSKL